MAFTKFGNLRVRHLPAVPGIGKKAGRVEKVQSNLSYLVVDGLDGDRRNQNDDLYVWHDAAYCRKCDLYLGEMILNHGATVAHPKVQVTEFCPLCQRPLDGAILHKNSEGAVGYKTWEGRPVCVGHVSNDPEKHYGRIVDTGIDHEDKTVQMLMGIDREKMDRDHPGLLDRYLRRIQSDVSQGCRVAFSLCSKCRHLARNEKEYCEHITNDRGRLLPVEKEDKPYPGLVSGEDRGQYVRVAELCYDITGIEESLVDHGACDVAKVLEVLHTASKSSSFDLQEAFYVYEQGIVLEEANPLVGRLLKAAAINRCREELN